MTRPLSSTPDQIAEVFRLADEGMTVRRIAREVYNDWRLKGRVERLLAARRSRVPPDPGALDALVAEMGGG